MKKLMMFLLLSCLSTTLLAQTATKKEKVQAAIQCGQDQALVLVKGVWSLVPFVGDFNLISLWYNDEDSAEYLKQKAQMAGLEEGAIVLSTNTGILGPIYDVFSMAVYGTAFLLPEATKAFLKGLPAPANEIQTMKEELSFQTTRATASIAMLQAKKAFDSCNELRVKLNGATTSKVASINNSQKGSSDKISTNAKNFGASARPLTFHQ